MEGCRGGARFTLVRSDLSVLLPAAASVVCAMIFLSITLFLVTMLLCYAGYIFLVVDRRADSAALEDPDLYDALDDKNYDFELPEEVDTYEDLRVDEPDDK